MTPLQNWKRRRDSGDASNEVGIDLGGFDDDAGVLPTETDTEGS